jgi:transcriptional regulator with PAS, ATPase and Fis domain
VQRLVIQMDDEEFVQPEHLSPKIRQSDNVLERMHPTKGTLREMMDQVEKWMLIEALKEHGNNKSQTAKTLGITREGLHKKLKGFGLG